jgi:glycerol-3-phosphate dehydrogenase (NAD(P)+)
MQQNKKIAVIGAGKWGSALQFALGFKQKCLITNRTKKDIKNFVDLNEALDCEYLVISISTQHIKQWLEEKFVFKNQKILVASKGIDANSGKFLKQIYKQFVPLKNLGFISGPSFASEVQKALPTALVINSKNKQLYDEFSLFFPDFIKIYYSDDIIGAEIAGAYKNVLAIASGICDGLGLGENARASLISRGLIEMSRFGRFYNSKDETFLGLSGAGDLFLTASSQLSRNFRVGLGLAKNKQLDTILEELGEVAEGVKTSEAIYNLAQKNNIYTPIADEVKFMLNGKNPKLSLKDLLSKSN